MEEKSRTIPYPLRMPDELRAKLEEAARAGSRSLHAEIVARLSSTFHDPLIAAKQMGSGLVEPWQPSGPIQSKRTDIPMTAEELEALAKRAGEAAAIQVLQAKGMSPARFGAPSVVQGPPPEPETKPSKKPKPAK